LPVKNTNGVPHDAHSSEEGQSTAIKSLQTPACF
jgi:hypothetical protein